MKHQVLTTNIIRNVWRLVRRKKIWKINVVITLALGADYYFFGEGGGGGMKNIEKKIVFNTICITRKK